MSVKQNVLYVLGAGFTAPLEIPVVSNFLAKSKDMFAIDSEKYEHFGEIYEEIKALSFVKNYMECNLFNIEEILSLLEMKYHVGEEPLRNKFERYISDVISFYTPEINLPDPLELKEANAAKKDNWHTPFWGRGVLSNYGKFFANLIHFQINKKLNDMGDPKYYGEIVDYSETNYAVITLNYDTIFEKFVDHLNNYYMIGVDKIDHESKFHEDVDYYNDKNIFGYAKIHGSIEPLNIVAPTWNKTNNPDFVGVWKLAHELISNANCIRFIGYSMPETDNHVKYLLMSGIMNTKNLKEIDVICLDESNEVKKRYRRLISYDNLRFYNYDVRNYLEKLHFHDSSPINRNIAACSWDNLEIQHRKVFYGIKN